MESEDDGSLARFAAAFLGCRKGPEKMKLRRALLSALSAVLLCPVPSAAQGKDIVGRVEKARIFPGDLLVRAKIDTGAKDCSLGALNMTKFSEGDVTWVRFKVKNHLGEEATIVKKVIREAKIKQKGRASERRPVVLLGICLGRQYREVQENLLDRSQFNYPLLIGRSFMRGHIIVDPELKYTSEPACVGAPMP